LLIQLGGKGCDIPILFFTWNRTRFHLVWPKSGSLNKPTTKDTKYRSCFITCMSQALYPLYRVRMGPKEFSSYPQNKRDKKPYPWGTKPYIYCLFNMTFKQLHQLNTTGHVWLSLIMGGSHLTKVMHLVYRRINFACRSFHCSIKITAHWSSWYICP